MITLIPYNLKVDSIHAKMRDLMLHIVGTGVLDCPQPFCRFATFPLAGGITSTAHKAKWHDLQSKTHFTPACTLQFISPKTKKRRALGKISTSFYQKNTLFSALNMRNCKTKNIHFWLLSLFTLCAKRRK